MRGADDAKTTALIVLWRPSKTLRYRNELSTPPIVGVFILFDEDRSLTTIRAFHLESQLFAFGHLVALFPLFEVIIPAPPDVLGVRPIAAVWFRLLLMGGDDRVVQAAMQVRGAMENR